MQVDVLIDENTQVVATSAQEFEDFIYLISHDVRNSVRALLELPQWIEEDLEASGYPVDDSLAETLALMNTHMRRLDRMLIDLLVYSRIGRMQSGGEADWNETLETVLDQQRMPPGFRLIRDIQVPRVMLGKNDAVTLVGALVSNAVKHHDRAQGTIRLSTREAGAQVLLEVADDGPGIAPAHRERAFKVMSTLKPRDQIEGSGMGLANVRKIVTHYGGRIEWADPAAMRGCHLRLWLPKADTG